MKYEFKEVLIGTSAIWDHYSKEGWDLVAVSSSRAYFKRPLEESKKKKTDEPVQGLSAASSK